MCSEDSGLDPGLMGVLQMQKVTLQESADSGRRLYKKGVFMV